MKLECTMELVSLQTTVTTSTEAQAKIFGHHAETVTRPKY